ncbi:MAG: hypothetical protein R3E46_18940, partial [Sedimenticolaceae bacterium]
MTFRFVHAFAWYFLEARGGAYSFLIALGSARQRYSSLLAQRRVTRRKGTPRLGRRYAPTPLRSSVQNR